MIDFDKTVGPGDIDSGFVNVVVEIPKGGKNKLEWDNKKLVMRLDRILPEKFSLPTNYGFIPGTLCEDGDCLDVLFVADKSILPGTIIHARIVGLMKFEDNGQTDDKVIAVPVDSEINSLADLSKEKINQITYHFNHYEDDQKVGATAVKSWCGLYEAKKVIRESIENWHKKISAV